MAATARWRRLLATAAVIGLAAAGLAYAFWPSPVIVDLAPVARGSLEVAIAGEGKTRIKEIYAVSTPVAGRVLRLQVHAGDAVKANDTVVAVIQPAEPTFLDVRARAQAEAAVLAAEAAKALAEAELAQVNAELSFARSDLERSRTLARRDTIARRELERAELEVQTREAVVATARAAVSQADAELQSARAVLIQPGQHDAAACCIEVRSPESGQVLRVLSESEAVVTAGTPLLEIGDPGDLEIVVDLLSADAVRVKPGAAVYINHWGGDTTLAGRVRLVEPSGFTKVSALGIEEQRVNVVIDFADPPQKWLGLGDAFRVDLRIVVWHAADILKIPVSALFREREDWAVFVAVDGRAQRRRVVIGERNSTEAEVTAGLTADDVVIMHPSDRVEDGVRVEARVVMPE
jgi:HlyD family secretion protein